MYVLKTFIVLLIFYIYGCCLALQPTNLRVEYLRPELPSRFTTTFNDVEEVNDFLPRVVLGIDTQTPRFFWELLPYPQNVQGQVRDLKQTAYHLVIEKIFSLPLSMQEIALPGQNTELIWCDSGVITSSSSLHVTCELPRGRLTSDTTYRWSIKIWDNQAIESPWISSFFHTALFEPQEVRFTNKNNYQSRLIILMNLIFYDFLKKGFFR